MRDGKGLSIQGVMKEGKSAIKVDTECGKWRKSFVVLVKKFDNDLNAIYFSKRYLKGLNMCDYNI